MVALRVSARYVRHFIDMAVEHGADRGRLLRHLPGEEAALACPLQRVPADGLLDLLDEACAQTGRSDLGLICGVAFRPQTFLDTGYGLMLCASLRDVAAYNARYQRLTQEIGRTALEEEDGEARLVWTPAMAQRPGLAAFTEAVLAGCAVMGRWLVWMNDTGPRAVHLRHAAPAHREALEALFGCPVVFDSPRDMMVLDPELLDRPLPQANAELLGLLSERLDRALQTLDEGPSLQMAVTQCIQAFLCEGPPRLEAVAQRLGLSARTLRRRLAEEATGFRELVEAARREACAIHLREGRLSMAQIAQALGYSEQSAFARAFRSWHGVPPGARLREPERV
jgi:AraC-like DNA-binding protein